MFDTALFLKRTELKLLLALKPKPNFSDQSQVIQVQNQISNTKSNPGGEIDENLPKT